MGYKFQIDDWISGINSVIEYLKYKDQNGGLRMSHKGQEQVDSDN